VRRILLIGKLSAITDYSNYGYYGAFPRFLPFPHHRR
jgi:hypothetical protein